MVPKLLLPSVPPTELNIVWFHTLKNSPRSCSRADSPNRPWEWVPSHGKPNSFTAERSQLLYPGRRKRLRPALPKVPWAGNANAAVLNHLPVGMLVNGSPTRLDRSQMLLLV